VATYHTNYQLRKWAGYDVHWSNRTLAATVAATIVSNAIFQGGDTTGAGADGSVGTTAPQSSSSTGFDWGQMIRDVGQNVVRSAIQYRFQRHFGDDTAHWNTGMVLADAFGNALGNAVVRGMQQRAADKQAALERMRASNPFGLDALLDRNATHISEEAASQLSALSNQLSGSNLDQLLNMGGSVGPGPSSANYDSWSSAQKSGYWNALTQNLYSFRVGGGGDPYGNAAEVAMLVGIREQLDAVTANASAASRFGADAIQVFTAALAAKDVYYAHSIPELLPRGVERVTGDAALMAELGLRADMLINSKSGYFAAAYRLGDSGQYLIANRGTEGAGDMSSNALQAAGLSAPQYRQAMRVAFVAQQKLGERVTFTGHSLGGGLASAQALRVRGQAITFNAAGLHENTVAAYGITPEAAGQYVRAYYVRGEVLSTFQDGGKLGVASALSAGQSAGAQLAPPGMFYWQQASVLSGRSVPELIAGVPAAAGQRFGLNPMEAPRMGSGGQGWLPGGGIMPLSVSYRSLELHGMSQAIYSLYGASGLDTAYRSATGWTPPPTQPLVLPQGAQLYWPPVRADGSAYPIIYGGKR
jgi:hypothetical protein